MWITTSGTLHRSFILYNLLLPFRFLHCIYRIILFGDRKLNLYRCFSRHCIEEIYTRCHKTFTDFMPQHQSNECVFNVRQKWMLSSSRTTANDLPHEFWSTAWCMWICRTTNVTSIYLFGGKARVRILKDKSANVKLLSVLYFTVYYVCPQFCNEFRRRCFPIIDFLGVFAYL